MKSKTNFILKVNLTSFHFAINLIKPAKINKQAGDYLFMLEFIEVFETRLLSAM